MRKDFKGLQPASQALSPFSQWSDWVYYCGQKEAVCAGLHGKTSDLSETSQHFCLWKPCLWSSPHIALYLILKDFFCPDGICFPPDFCLNFTDSW